MGPEAFTRLMAYNKDSSGFAAAFRQELFRPPRGGGSLNGDLGVRAAERGGAGDSTAYPIQDYNLDYDCRQAGMGDVDYRGEAARSNLGDASPFRDRIGMRLPPSRRAVGPHRSRSPLAPHRKRSPLAPHRKRSPFAPHKSRSPLAPQRSRPPLAPHGSRSPLAPHRSRSPLGAHGIHSPHPSLSRRWSPRPRSAHSTARRSRSRSRSRGGTEPRLRLQKRNQLRKSYCIKVCNVPPHTVYSAIWSRFKPFVTAAYVEMNGEDCSALVYLEKLEDREKALASEERILDEGMTMMLWEGGSAALPPDPIDAAHPKASRTLLVSHLDKSVSRKDLRNNFQRFGRIVDVEIKRIPRAKHYYALMQFFTVNSVCQAITRMDGTDMGGSRVHLSFGVTPESKCICVRGLTRGLSSDYIMQRFMRFGQVDKVAYNPLSCMALVLFKTIAQASQAIHHVKKNPSENIIVDYADDNYQLLFCRTMQTVGLDSGDFLFL